MNRDEFETLREGWDFEAKLAEGQAGTGSLPRSIWSTYSAMANTDGGRILLGARELPDGGLEPVGIRDPDRVERDLWNTIQNTAKVSVNLLRRESVERIRVDGRTLLLIHVPKAPRDKRPVEIFGERDGGIFLRVHEGDRRASVEDIRRMIADSIPQRDQAEVEELEAADLDPASTRRYREFFAARRPDHPFLQHDDTEFLIRVGALHRGRSHRVPRPTWAGLWMLGKEHAIRSLLPAWHLSYRELPDAGDEHRRWLDRVHPDGTWNANLFEFYLRVIVRLHAGLKVPFQLSQGQYRVDETPVHDAVREALVNTLTHADHQGTTGIRVIKRRSGFEFINPGLLLVTPEQVWKGGTSQPRNPALQRLFAQLQLGEREGSGGPAMRRVWRDQHWRSPRIWNDGEQFETHLELSLESLLPEHAVQSLIERWGTSFTNQSELGRIILVTAEAEGIVTHARVRALVDAHSRDLTLKLQELVRNGMLFSTNEGRLTVYRSSGRSPLPLFDRDQGRDPSDRSDATSGRSDATSGRSDATSGRSDATSERSDATSERSDATSERSDATPTPAEPATDIPEVRHRDRVSREVTDQAIVAVCADAFLTRDEIAVRIDRAVNTLRARFLPRLVREGRLELRFPETPNHPAQAYRARREESPFVSRQR